MLPFYERAVSDLERSRVGSLPSLRTNIRLGWKGLPRTKSVAYFEHISNYSRKELYNIGPKTRIFVSVIYEFLYEVIVFVKVSWINLSGTDTLAKIPLPIKI